VNAAVCPPPSSCYDPRSRWEGAVGELESGSASTTAANDEDSTLVRAMANGDRDALARLYDRYSPVLLAVAARILGERREAEDLLHDVFLEVWRQAADYDDTRGTVRSWILVRLRSRALDRRKSAGATRVVSIETERALDLRQASGDDPSLAPDRTKLRRVLATLPEEQRTVLELGYFEGLSSSEIATRIDAPIGTVKSRVAAALAKLRAGLGDLPGGEP
jgi:RNA polymerase sigma-70 factor (ECF subfamily)